ncbi:MAG: glutamine synthetase III [Bacilli bacterium]|nr:glutamine synthetase III [Bacilli bacterium]
MKIVPEEFAKLAFNEKVMKELLPPDVYSDLNKTIQEGKPLNISLASKVAEVMKDWAIANGATHYTHWFLPLSGVTAEKHESFLTTVNSGNPVLELSGKELIKGEPDASSFPSGGLRTTFEARGYTAWDPTSYAFIKGNTLCIPTAFCSYGGHALDKKTPLLRSLEALNKEALKIFKIFKMDDVKHINVNVGPEQEYFLIDKSLFEKRMDLKFTGRTLFGYRSPKGQELDDQYFGNLKPRVAKFMEEVDHELWKLGISAKTEHNEVAPSQHELAVIYTSCNLACDQNQIVMEVLSKVADKHHFVVLFHEKPFAGVNGSGKHNNYSLSTDTGINLLVPGETPEENKLFLLFLAAFIQAVDNYQDLLRISVATSSNDFRLGKNEAPPAIISMFIGEELEGLLTALAEDKASYKHPKETIQLGVQALPDFTKDNTDRNRTSPFAYTGNKFEFRSLGSSKGLSDTNTVLNTIIAESLCEFSEKLSKSSDLDKDLHTLIVEVIKNHKRIIFGGNGYDESWVIETKKRGLSNYPSTPVALAHFDDPKNVELFTKHKIFTVEEIKARKEIEYQNYVRQVEIEMKTMVHMLYSYIMPSINRYIGKLSHNIKSMKEVDPSVPFSYQHRLLSYLSKTLDEVDVLTKELDEEYPRTYAIKDFASKSTHLVEVVIPLMEKIRGLVDSVEKEMPKYYWPFPTYEELLFSED